MFVMMEMEIGRYLFVTIYVYRKFEKYFHSERKGGGLMYREHLLLYDVFFIVKWTGRGKGASKWEYLSERTFWMTP